MRKPRRQQTEQLVDAISGVARTGSTDDQTHETIRVQDVPVDATGHHAPLSPMSRASRQRSEENQSHPHQPPPQYSAEAPHKDDNDPPYSSPVVRRASTHNATIDHSDHRGGNLSPEIDRRAFAGSGGVNLEHETPSGKTDTSSASSYRDLSWATMFEHLVERQLKGEGFVDKCSITYLGESFPLSILLAGGGKHPPLHHSGPPYPINEEAAEIQSLHHPPYMRPEDIAYLEAKKAFELPDKEMLDTLIGVFLDRVFPLYPIVIRQEFLEQHQFRKMPWILVHATCFLAATFCPLHILYRCGFQGRRQARWSFYSKAKVLFDVGYEENKIVLLQVSIMMSFWGGGPNNYWNFYSWISTAVTIAETLGCHRSMAGANVKPLDRSLLKRLWRVLIIRDTGCAALVGRPFRINLDHSDSEPLTSADFQHDIESADFAHSPYAPVFGLYQMEATRLTLILRRIITTRYYPSSRETADPASLTQLLTEWHSVLPPSLKWPEAISEYSNVFASTLAVIYSHSMILAHLNRSPETSERSPDTAHNKEGLEEDILIPAAQRIAATACTVITKSDILLAPHEIFHGIFTAAVVFYTQKRSGNPLAAQLGMAGLTNCQMVMHQSWEHWDSSPWIAQLFDKVLCSPSVERCSAVDEEGEGQGVTDYMNNSGPFQGTELLDQGYDMWHVHPVLGSLFDVMPGAPVPMAPSFGDWLDHQPEFASGT